METTVKLVLNEDGAFLVFKDEDEVHQYIKYIPSYHSVVCFGGYMNAIKL